MPLLGIQTNAEPLPGERRRSLLILRRRTTDVGLERWHFLTCLP